MKTQKMTNRALSSLSACAKSLVKVNMNSTCASILFQDKAPKSALKFKK